MLVLTKELNAGVKLCTYVVAISAMDNNNCNAATMIDSIDDSSTGDTLCDAKII